MSHETLVKAVEYLLAVGAAALFVPFWRYIDSTTRSAPREETAPEPERQTAASGPPRNWRAVPAGRHA